MADMARPKPAEYYNPRPLILGLCFVWGIAVGFFLFYFAPPKNLGDAQPARSNQPATAPAQMSELERRRQDIPVIADVDIRQDPAAASTQPRLETMELDPPAPIITTEGGLTGRMARPLRPVPARTGGPAPAAPTGPPGFGQPSRPAAVPAPAPLRPPPIPELLP